MRLGLSLGVLVVTGSVMTTLSRGGLLALGAIVLLTLALPARAMFRSGTHKLAMAMAVVLAAAVGFSALSGTFAPRLNSLLSEGGGTGRLILWQGALTAIKERPVTGLGYGGYQSSSNNLIFRTPGVSVAAYDLHPEGQPAHSAYIGTTAELGVPGLLLFLGVLVSTARALLRVSSRARARGAWAVSRVANALLISLAGWALASLFLSSETSRPLWIIVGITLALPKLLMRSTPPGSLP
jgi:O-antigen ligase